MICLDTNYLISGLTAGSREEQQIKQWHKEGEALAASSVCWYEFLCGPVTNVQIGAMTEILQGGILGFGQQESAKAAELFNAVKRARHLRVDSMIAATAITSNAKFATNNRADFEVFIKFGLKLI